MSDIRKAAQAVIQAWDDPGGTTGVCRALDDLRAALVTVPSDCPYSHQPNPEPVAWRAVGGSIWGHKGSEDDTPLYTHPPQQQEPVCDECRKSKADGWALYCVDCMEPVFGQRKPLAKCNYPDCVDNGSDGKCTRWLLAECEKSEDYQPPQREPMQDHEDWCASVTQLLMSYPPRKAPCNCKKRDLPGVSDEQ